MSKCFTFDVGNGDYTVEAGVYEAAGKYFVSYAYVVSNWQGSTNEVVISESDVIRAFELQTETQDVIVDITELTIEGEEYPWITLQNCG